MAKSVTGECCPFCGASKLSVDSKTYRDGYGKRMTYAVRCNCCHARGGTVGGYIKANSYSIRNIEIVSEAELISKAIEKWNTRSGCGKE